MYHFTSGLQRAASAVQQARVRPAHAQRLHEELARGADLAQREGGQGARQGLGRPQPQRSRGTFMPCILSANMVLLDAYRWHYECLMLIFFVRVFYIAMN